MENGRLEFIKYDGHTFSKCNIGGSSRPNFDSEVYTYLSGEPRRDRCHSLSFGIMQSFLINVMNYYGITDEGLIAIEKFGRIFSIRKDCSFARLINALEVLKGIWRAEEVDITMLVDALNKVLGTMNSITINLRYSSHPTVREGNTWNRSVQENYDPKEWCYVENNTVWSDNNGSKEIAASEYKPILVPDFAGDGFYLLNQIDGLLLSRIYNLYRGMPEEAKARLCIASAHTGNYRFLFSSSNTVKLPLICDEFTAPIHFLKWETIFGEKGPKMYRVWHRFDDM